MKEKGCQQDEYSQGYLKNIQMGDIRPDVLGIRYEILKNRAYPVIHFHGHVVEVKCDKKGLNEVIGKIIRIKKRIRSIMSGLNTVRLYIAYSTDQVYPEIFNICEEEGIGILRLQAVDDDIINVYEVLRPKEITLSGIPHRRQRSPGNFEDSINEINYLRQMFQRPWKLYDDFIRPKIEEYNEQINTNEWLGTLTNRYAKDAFNILEKRIFMVFPQLNLEYHKGFAYSNNLILQIYIGTGNFKIVIDDTMYRIHAKNDIIEFKGKEGKKYEGDIEKLIDDVIIPYIKRRIGY